MAIRKVARLRTSGAALELPTAWHATLARIGMGVLDCLNIVAMLLLLAVPVFWVQERSHTYVNAWMDRHFSGFAGVEDDWATVPRVPDFTRGDEAEVQAFLGAHPLVLAVRDRTGDRALWIRKGDRLVAAAESPLEGVIRPWFVQADQLHRVFFNPEGALPGEVRPGPKILLMGDRWMVAKGWQEGSPEVERFLRNALGPRCPFRVMLHKDGDGKVEPFPPRPWGAEPNLQVDPGHFERDGLFRITLASSLFPGWDLWMVSTRKDSQAYRRYRAFQSALAIAGVGLVEATLLFALGLRSRSQRKAALDADRLAAMTHGLKTPLAVQKFRCDTLLLRRLPPEEMDSQLTLIGEDCDRLTSMIDHTLMAIQGTSKVNDRSEVTPEWIMGVAGSYMPAFEAAGRELVLACCPRRGLAPLPALREALSTLVENALHHGQGTVTLESRPTRRGLRIQVSDQGPGLESHELLALGRPFMRIREKGREGFRMDGRGLGLSLLAVAAEQEGWGLAFASSPGKGMSATLDILALR
jgi:signal transduction histidine kinase